MIKACDLTKNSVVEINGDPHVVEQLRVQSPSARGAATLYKIRFRNVFANYGWRIQAWAPQDCGRTLIVCGFPTKIYNTVPRRRRPAARYTGEGR